MQFLIVTSCIERSLWIYRWSHRLLLRGPSLPKNQSENEDKSIGNVIGYEFETKRSCDAARNGFQEKSERDLET